MPPTSKPLVEEIEPKFEWVQIEGCDTLLVHLTEDCDVNGITAKFEGGVLKIKLPKVPDSAMQKEEHKQEINKTPVPSVTEDEKLRGEAAKRVAKAADEKEAEDEKRVTEGTYKKMLEGKSRTKKIILLAVIILGVGVALGLRMLQMNRSVRQIVNDM